MKKFIFISLLFISFTAICQVSGTMYVAAKSGLNMREAAGTNSKVLENIPYGTTVEIIQADEEYKSQLIENMLGYWQKVKYKNKTGYILDVYLLPWTPPMQGMVKEMKDYIDQVTSPYGKKLIIKSNPNNQYEEASWIIEKQLYYNGAEWHQQTGYEYGSDTWFLPGFTIQQGFLLLRLIPEFKYAIGESDAFPATNKSIKRGEYEQEYKITVEKEDYGNGDAWYKKVSIEYEDGAFYELQMFLIDNQLVISFSSGV